MGIIAELLLLAGPLLTGWIIDFLTEYDGGSLATFYWLVFAFLITAAGAAIFRLKTKLHGGLTARELMMDVRIKGLNKIMELDLAWHETGSAGGNMAKIEKGADSLRKFLRFFVFDGMSIPVGLTASLIIFAAFDLKYMLFVFLIIAAFAAIEIYGNRIVAIKENNLNKAREKAIGRVFEFSSNIRTIKSMNLVKSIETKAKKAEAQWFKRSYERSIVQNRKWRGIQAVSAIGSSLFMLLVGYDIIAGRVSVGMLVVYLGYFNRVYSALKSISSSSDNVIEWQSGIRRLMTVFKAASAIETDSATKQLPKDWKSIKFENVTFAYKHHNILKDVNLTIKRGEKIGIVGESGEGKSTFFKLFLKLYLPDKGIIRFNDTPIEEIKRKSLLDNIAAVQQDTELFRTTFKENITIARTKHSPQHISNAIRVADCGPIIPKLTQGVNTIIGEKGVKLSGGERQRLGIARAVYRNSEIYLFDEATSHLDSNSERKIMDQLIKAMKNKTILMIAHRLSTLRDMDRIIVFKQGKITEQGTFKSLIQKKGQFYKLYKQQQMKK